MKVIGLTGGIASGKSTASKVLKEIGIKIIDADLIAREIVKPGEAALLEIIEVFGTNIVDKDGVLKRSELSRIVFNNKKKLEKLNSITHTRIIERINNEIEKLKCSKQHEMIVLDVALLIELKLFHFVDEVWLIVVEKEVQVERLMNRENMSKADALKIIDAQMQLKEKKKFADILIDNTGSIESMKNQLLFHTKRIMEER